ncbi:MAG TPA: ABC transporter substrate-binding protein [Candidatus Nanoarchaeia archaeon]|nr:ABC transporter substrate-binding protein [Candidatus Nanoarchaeia archaeon]
MRYLSCVLLLIFLAGCAASQSEVKVGAMGPFTGYLAQFGEWLTNGFELAKEEINANGGINGKQLVLVYEDDKCIDNAAVTNGLKKFTEIDNLPGMVGPFCGGPNALAGTFTNETDFFVVAPGDNHGHIGRYMVNTRYLLAKEAHSMADFAVQNDLKRVGILYYDNEWGQGYRAEIRRYLADHGGELVAAESYVYDNLDVRSQLLKLKASNPDAVVIIDATRGELFDQAREIGLNASFISEWEVETVEGKARESIEGVHYFLPVGGDASFEEKFKAKYGHAPNMVERDSYDALMLMAKALKNCPDQSPQCMTDYVTALKDYPGAGGNLTFNKESWSFDKPIVHKTVKDGKFVEVS